MAWVQTGASLASRMPGYLGSGWVRAGASSSLWYTLYRFADAGSLAGWESSEERRWWLRSGEEFVHDARVERRTGIEGWFDVPASDACSTTAHRPPRARAPPRWKQAVTIWLGFFPTNLVFSLLAALLPVWGTVPLALRVLITTIVLTPVMTYLVLPFVTARLRPWLDSTGPRRRHPRLSQEMVDGGVDGPRGSVEVRQHRGCGLPRATGCRADSASSATPVVRRRSPRRRSADRLGRAVATPRRGARSRPRIARRVPHRVLRCSASPPARVHPDPVAGGGGGVRARVAAVGSEQHDDPRPDAQRCPAGPGHPSVMPCLGAVVRRRRPVSSRRGRGPGRRTRARRPRAAPRRSGRSPAGSAWRRA